MLTRIVRRSPVSFGSRPGKTEIRDHWKVVLEYEDEGKGPYLIDLSHNTRWDVQDNHLADIQPWGISIPDKPGRCSFQNGILVNRMNRTQASVWDVFGKGLVQPTGPAYTEITESSAFLALVGRGLVSITEKLGALDFFSPAGKPPFLLQGPFSHVPCQMVMLERKADRCGILFTFSRGYARDMAAAILEAGEEVGLRPAGEKAFQEWIKGYGGGG